MKKIIIFLILILVPIFSYSQNKNKKEEDVKITINVSKINHTLGSIVGFLQNEVKQFKEETNENLSSEAKENIKKIKEDIKYELKYTRDAIHQGYVTGLRGEPYTPPYEHK